MIVVVTEVPYLVFTINCYTFSSSLIKLSNFYQDLYSFLQAEIKSNSFLSICLGNTNLMYKLLKKKLIV